jgi:hypothetical protein
MKDGVHRLLARISAARASLSLFRETAGIWYILQRLVDRISLGAVQLHAYGLVAQPVRREPMLPDRRGAATSIREIGLEEALTLPVDRPRGVVERRFQRGARCLAANLNGKFAGYLWFQLAPYHEDEVRCLFVPLPAGSTAWDFDVYVDPSARAGPTFARLWDEANRILSSMGVAWSLSRISLPNRTSLNAHGRLGAVRLATALFLTMGKMQVALATIRPYVHVGLGTDAYPVLRLQIE